MCVISFANCWSVFPSDLAMAPSVRRAFWETAGETSELAKARSSNASVDSLKKKMKAKIQLEEGRRWRSSPGFWLYYATIKLGRRGKRKKKGSRKAGEGKRKKKRKKKESRKAGEGGRKVGSERIREEEKGGKREW